MLLSASTYILCYSLFAHLLYDVYIYAVDLLYVVGVDYRGPWDWFTGLNAPTYPALSEEENEWSKNVVSIAPGRILL